MPDRIIPRLALDDAPWMRWASDELSATTLKLVEARGLDLDDLLKITKPLSKRLFNDTEVLLDYAKSIIGIIGKTENDVDLFLHLIINNHSIFDTNTLREALYILSNKRPLRGLFVPSFGGVFVPSYFALLSISTNSLLRNTYSVRRVLKGIFDLESLYGDVEIDNPEDSFNLFLMNNTVRRFYPLDKNFLKTEVEWEFIITSNIERWRDDSSQNSVNSSVLHILCGNGFLEKLECISVFGVYIKGLPAHRRIVVIEGLLERSLPPVFDALDVPDTERQLFVRTMAMKLLGIDEDIGISLKPNNEAVPPAVASVTSGDLGKDMPVPSVAPALWKQDRTEVDGKLENPVEFTQRHYGQWLGNGLTTAHILRLDPDLYARLEDFLSPRSNKRGKKTVPEGFVLPKRAEAPETWISRVRSKPKLFDQEIEPTLETAKELERMAKAIRRDLAKANAK